MSTSRGRGKINTLELKKDEKQPWAGSKLSSNSLPITPTTNNTFAKPLPVNALPNTESAMDEYLAKLNLYRKPVAKDGSCLFRVVSEQIYNTQAKHIQVRFECIDFMRKEKNLFEAFVEGSYEHHLYSLKNPKEWGGQVEISALSLLYQRDFIVYQSVNTEPQAVTCNNFKKKILLCYSNGNHYDAVYPLTFKANAAMAQALIYDVILDNAFQEMESREESRDIEASKMNETNEWTEVKNKQKDTKDKPSEDSNNRVNSVFPESAKNQKIYWQLKRSFDPTYYRNIELEVWEDYRADITKNDYVLAASMQQLRPGEICLATIKEAKDVSEIIRVKIHEINPDKCIVYSEDEKTRYYVQLYDLQPIVNGDESYKNLPGYYNKMDERDSEFQHQKRRGKGGKKYRDDESKKGDHQVRSSDATKRQDGRANGRRSSRGIDKKREPNEKSSNPSVRRVKSDQDIKRIDRPEETNRNAVTSPDDPTKVAKPAESAAAFWGRMRTTKTVGASTNGSPTNSKTPSPIEPTTISMDAQPKVNSPLLQDAPLTPPTPPTPNANENKRMSVSSTTADKTHTSSPQIIKDSKKPAWGVIRNPETSTTHLPKSNVENVPTKTFKNDILPTEAKGADSNQTSITSKSNGEPTLTLENIPNNEKNIIDNLNSEKPNENSIVDSSNNDINKLKQSNYNRDKQKHFNFTSHDSAKINEVRENIKASSAKMTVTPSDDSETVIANNTPEEPVQPESQLLGSVHVTSPSADSSPVHPVKVSEFPENNEDVSSFRAHENHDDRIRLTTFDSKKSQKTDGTVVNDIPSTYIVASTSKANVLVTTANGLSNTNVINSEPKLPNGDINRTVLNNQQTPEKLDERQERGKKRVSFGTTQIFDNQHVVSHVPIDITTSMSPHTALPEPGKIVLPPEHIEKHQNEFTSGVHSSDLHAHAQQQPQIVQSFIPSQQALPIYQPVQGFPVFRMAYNNMQEHPTNNILTPTVSFDPEGKDLPDDISVLRHFYNLGVQWFYLSQNQQNNYHVTQPGILPAPVQHPIGNTPIRQILMASDSPLLRSVDCYSPNSQTIDTTAHLEQLNHIQQTSVGSAYLSVNQRNTNSINSVPNLNQLPHPTSYEEYELPPRLQRGGGANNRSTNHRQFFPQQRPFLSGGRGIIGQSPRHRYPIRTPSHTIY